MSPMILFGTLAFCLAFPVLAWAVVAGSGRNHQQVMANLQRGLVTPDTPASDGSGVRRGAWGGMAHRVTPRADRQLLERLWQQAGRPEAWPLDRILSAKLLLSVAALVLTVLMMLTHPSTTMLALGIGCTVVAWFVPELLLYSRSQERAQAIALELADTLDQMTIAVEAGLGFDAAMERSARNGKGALADEMRRTLQDMQLGQSRREAYEGMAQRSKAPDLRRFVRAIVQGDKHGVAIADVLRVQAAEMRLKRRQRAEEKAMQIPVKVIFPLMLCILPVLFIVLLGPTVINVLKVFS